MGPTTTIHFYFCQKDGQVRVFDILEDEGIPGVSVMGEVLLEGMPPLLERPDRPPIKYLFCWHAEYYVEHLKPDQMMEHFAATHGLSGIHKFAIVKNSASMAIAALESVNLLQRGVSENLS